MKRRPGKKADTVTPVGGGEPIPPRPARVPITNTDNERAAAEGNAAMARQGLEEFVGLWTADVED